MIEEKECTEQSFSYAKISATGESLAESQTPSSMIPLLSAHSSNHDKISLKREEIHSDALLLLNIAYISPSHNSNQLHAEAPHDNEEHTIHSRARSNALNSDIQNHQINDLLESPPASQRPLDTPFDRISLPFVDSVDTSGAQQTIMKSKSSPNDTSPSLQSKHDSKIDYLSKNAFYGSISLFSPADVDSLSPLHNFIRKHGIEAFVATEQEANNKDFWFLKNFKVKPGRVGIQCIYCKHIPLRQRGPKAVHYPMTISNLYNSSVLWYHVHSSLCSEIPESIKIELENIRNRTKRCAGGRRRYWTESAIKLGMEDTPDGVIFSSHNPMHSQTKDDMNGPHYDKASSNLLDSNSNHGSKCSILVNEADKNIASEYLFLLLSQMEPCTYSDEDRTMNRSKNKNDIGYPGLQCIHCHGKSGVGRYFPVSREYFCLSNSDRNMFNHLTKCRKCPETIKMRLTQLDKTRKREKPRGTRKVFFTRVWNRLHSIEEHQTVHDQDDESGICIEHHPIENHEIEHYQVSQDFIADPSLDNFRMVDFSDFPDTEFGYSSEHVVEQENAHDQSKFITNVPDPYENISSALFDPV
jgi:hypothetical protein